MEKGGAEAYRNQPSDLDGPCSCQQLHPSKNPSQWLCLSAQLREALAGLGPQGCLIWIPEKKRCWPWSLLPAHLGKSADFLSWPTAECSLQSRLTREAGQPWSPPHSPNRAESRTSSWAQPQGPPNQWAWTVTPASQNPACGTPKAMEPSPAQPSQSLTYSPSQQ